MSRTLPVIGALLFAVAGVMVAVAAFGLHQSAGSVEAQPLPPAKFYGTVTVNGAPAPVGSDIRAKVNGEICGQALVKGIDGVGANAYNVDVLHSGQQAGCGNVGDTVTFEWASTPTGSEFMLCGSGTWDNTHFNQLNLVCGAAPTATPTPSPSTTGQPTPTPSQPAKAPVTGSGPADGSFAWWPLALSAAIVAAAGGLVALRRAR